MDICELSPQNCFVFEQRTNFDKVTLSPKTLAEFVNKIIDLTEICECPMWEFGIKKCTSGSCEECIANWLKQGVGDEEGTGD